MLGIHCRLPVDDLQATKDQIKGNKEQMQTSVQKEILSICQADIIGVLSSTHPAVLQAPPHY